MKLRAAVVTLCLLALPAWAAGSVDALRTASRSARAQVSQLKAQQLQQRNELSVLSSRIAALKGKSQGKLLRGGELDVALKRSQELSQALTTLAQQVSGREAELEAANLALFDALAGELTRLRAEFERQGDRERRRALIAQLRQVRAERDALRATLPPSTVPLMDTVRPSDDPEELLEQADLLRDNEEKVQRELKALEARIAERQQEVELDRQVQRFMGEESMFDDSDRRLRIQRTVTTPATLPQAAASGEVASGATTPPATSQASQVDTVGGGDKGDTTSATLDTGGFNSGGSVDPTPPPATNPTATPTPAGAYDSAGVRVTTASDARPQVGSQGARAVAGSDEEDLSDLEVERVRLQGLAEQLRRKAKEFEQRASQLK